MKTLKLPIWSLQFWGLPPHHTHAHTHPHQPHLTPHHTTWLFPFMMAPSVETKNWTRQSLLVGATPRKPRPQKSFSFGVCVSCMVSCNQNTALKKQNNKKKQSAAQTPSLHRPNTPNTRLRACVFICNLGSFGFVRPTIDPSAPPPLSPILRPFSGLSPSRPNTSFYTALKEDGGISSGLRNVLKTPF